MIALDTNVVVRLLVADDAVQAERARKLVAENQILIATTVLLECEWVLRSAYMLDADAIGRALEKLIGLPQLSLKEPTVVQNAILAYRQGLDFADALHLSGSREAECFATFDRTLRKRSNVMPDVAVIEP